MGIHMVLQEATVPNATSLNYIFSPTVVLAHVNIDVNIPTMIKCALEVGTDIRI